MNPLEALGAGPEFSAYALDLIPQEAVVIDRSYTILWLNRAKRLAHPDLEAGMKCHRAFENDAPCHFCLADQAREIGQYVRNPVCILTGPRRNVPRHVNITIAPLAGRLREGTGAGDEPRFLELVDNVEAIYQSHSELERLNHEYENVIYALSHDLRSPLISIEGFLNKIEKILGKPLAEPMAHSLDRIHANVKIMNQLVNVLLDTSRIITGILDLHETDMERVAHEAAERFAAQAAEQGALIEVNGDFKVETCDRVRISQVYANLIGNALKHCSRTKGLKIELGAGNGVYWVRDNGPGIPRDFQDVVFEPFSQGSKQVKESFGMGMNIVFRIMQKHEGEIWLDSNEGRGTTVFFAFKSAPHH
ncbi:MAG: HAMP domain-containing histidine kinase [Spirochaetales bacterium]|nr:HAMP domain-containing histidine kinase [Spirochaetales bacterium]